MADEEKTKETTETHSTGGEEEEGKTTTGGLRGDQETTSVQETSPEGDESPLKVTKIAADKIKEIAAENHFSSFRLRVKVIGGGCAGFAYDLSFDEKTVADAEGTKKLPSRPGEKLPPGHLEVNMHGVCLVVDQMSLMYLRGTEIDYVETLQATGFKFNNPNVTSTCGCQQSFNV